MVMPKHSASDFRKKTPSVCLRNRLFMFLVYSFIFIKSISHYYLILKLFFCHIAQFNLILSFFHTIIYLICTTVFILIKSDCPENFNRFFLYTKSSLLIDSDRILYPYTTVSTPATLPGSSEALYPPAASPRGCSVISHMPSFPVLPYQNVCW